VQKDGKGRKRKAEEYEDALDMYADDFDEKEKARIEKKSKPEEAKTNGK
jgi:hypothetical protein